MIAERYGKYEIVVFPREAGQSHFWSYKIIWNNSNQFVISDEWYESAIKAIDAARKHARDLNRRSAITCYEK